MKSISSIEISEGVEISLATHFTRNRSYSTKLTVEELYFEYMCRDDSTLQRMERLQVSKLIREKLPELNICLNICDYPFPHPISACDISLVKIRLRKRKPKFKIAGVFTDDA